MIASIRLRLFLARLICPARYAVVPRSPTKAMVRAASKGLLAEHRLTPEWISESEKHRHRYRAMIDVAQED